MPDPTQVPQLTDLGTRLAEDKERKTLESLLERLNDPSPDGKKTSNNAPASMPNLGGNLSNQETLKEEAIKSARHILQTVWSMQHMDKIDKVPKKL